MTKRKSTATRRAESEAAQSRAAAIRAEQDRKERRRRTAVVSAVVVVVLALVLGIGYAVQSRRDTSTAAGTPPTGAIGYAVPAGPDSAPVKVAVYEDFLCPFCGQFEAASRTALEKQVEAGKVQLQYHVLSFLDGSTSTEYSSRAANALAVVLDTSGPEVAKKFHDLLFENQPAEGSAGLSDAKLVSLAVQAGAKASAVQKGIDDRTFGQWVKNVNDQASKDGVNSTPTVKINGKTLKFTTTDELVTEVEKAIAKG
jgi:protein-disulfide isomerase